VNISRLLATLVATLLVVGSSTQYAAAQGGHKIAVVDVSVVFKQNAKFNAQMEDFKKRVEAAEAGLKKRFEELQAQAGVLKDMAPAHKEYRERENALARGKADLQINTAQIKKDFLEQEGHVYFDVYRELDLAVKQVAERNGIALVLRYASDPVDDPKDRNEILRGINKPIVYVHPSLDITPSVMQVLNGGVPVPPTSPVIGTRPGAPRTN